MMPNLLRSSTWKEKKNVLLCPSNQHLDISMTIYLFPITILIHKSVWNISLDTSTYISLLKIYVISANWQLNFMTNRMILTFVHCQLPIFVQQYSINPRGVYKSDIYFIYKSQFCVRSVFKSRQGNDRTLIWMGFSTVSGKANPRFLFF
jgi:hypothetical protein